MSFQQTGSPTFHMLEEVPYQTNLDYVDYLDEGLYPNQDHHKNYSQLTTFEYSPSPIAPTPSPRVLNDNEWGHMDNMRLSPPIAPLTPPLQVEAGLPMEPLSMELVQQQQQQQQPQPYPAPCQRGNLMSWTNTHYSNWAVSQVLDWLYYLVDQKFVNDPSTFSDLRNQSEFSQPRMMEGETLNNVVSSTTQFAFCNSNMYDIEDTYFPGVLVDEGYDTPSCSDIDSEPPTSPPLFYSHDQASPLMPSLPKPPRRGSSNRGAPKGCGGKGNHLWEFVRDLLKNKECNPKLIKWEDERDGVFRFVQSEQVAKMWGQRKNNPNMTYEKLSRAMRYYYRRGILERVDGRRLVYKFGPNSHGWQ